MSANGASTSLRSERLTWPKIGHDSVVVCHSPFLAAATGKSSKKQTCSPNKVSNGSSGLVKIIVRNQLNFYQNHPPPVQ